MELDEFVNLITSLVENDVVIKRALDHKLIKIKYYPSYQENGVAVHIITNTDKYIDNPILLDEDIFYNNPNYSYETVGYSTEEIVLELAHTVERILALEQVILDNHRED